MDPGVKYMAIPILTQLEASIGWLSNATMEMRADAMANKYVFINADGSKSEHNNEINEAIALIALANDTKRKLIEKLSA